MSRFAAVAAVVALGIPFCAASAQDRPTTVPTRDVDVTYKMTNGDTTLSQRMRWDVAEQRLRVDPPGQGVYMIIDYRAHGMSLVRDAEHTVYQVQGVGLYLPGTGNAPFTRRGQETIAGLSCTDWDTRDNAGHPTTVCLTQDGVMLRVSSGGTTLAEAASVTYGKQDGSAFHAPQEYRHVNGPPQQMMHP